MTTDEKRRIQRLTESYVAHELQRNGHLILGRDIRRGVFEFDIVTRFKSTLYVHEVRGSKTLYKPFPELFSTTKVLTLLRGIEQQYPNARLLLHAVIMKSAFAVHWEYCYVEDYL